MLTRAVATRRMGVTRQREISDASLIYANDEDNDEDMSTRGPNDTIRREVNYRNFRERRLASDALATATARTAAEVIAAAHTRDERSGEGSRQLRERYEALMQNTTEQTEEAAAERPRWAHDDMTCPARPALNRHATTMAALAQAPLMLLFFTISGELREIRDIRQRALHVLSMMYDRFPLAVFTVAQPLGIS